MNDLFVRLTGLIYQYPEWSLFIIGCVTLIIGILAFVQLRRGLGIYISKKRLLKQFRVKSP